MVARWFPDDEILALGDSAYGGRSVLSHLPPNVHLISRVLAKEHCTGPARPGQKRKGPPARRATACPAWPVGRR